MLKNRYKSFFAVISTLFVSCLCKEELRWPKNNGLCPVDQVVNATCSCEENDEEKTFSCLSEDDVPSCNFLAFYNFKFNCKFLYIRSSISTIQ